MSQQQLSVISCGRRLEGTLRLPDSGVRAPCVVLCHGFGAPGDDLVPLADELFRLRPALARKVRFAFPEAPLCIGEGDAAMLARGFDGTNLVAAHARPVGQRSVPDQVAVLGVDNNEIICHLSNIPLSSVALTAEKGGYEAAELLDKLMQGRRNTKNLIEIKPSHVVTRASTAVSLRGGGANSRMRWTR
jgi:hypothetical protein